MKKIFTVSLFLLLTSFFAHAQDFKYEVYGGVSLPYITYPSSFRYEQKRGTSEMLFSGHLGLRAIIPIDVSLNDNMFYATAGLAFSGKGYKAAKMYKYYTHSGIEARAWSIDVPVRFGYKFKIHDGFALKAEVGLFGSLGLFGKWKDNLDNTGQYYDTDNKDTFGGNRIDAGLSGYLGAEFNRITAGIGYNHGLPSMGGLPYHAKSRNILISVGYLF